MPLAQGAQAGNRGPTSFASIAWG